MKNLITLAIVAIIFFAVGNTAKAQQAPKWTNQAIKISHNNVLVATAYETTNVLSNGKKVIITLIIPTNPNKAAKIVSTIKEASTKANTNSVPTVTTTTLPKNFANVSVKKTDADVVVSYEDMLYEKIIPVPVLLAQK